MEEMFLSPELCVVASLLAIQCIHPILLGVLPVPVVQLNEPPGDVGEPVLAQKVLVMYAGKFR